MTTTSVESTERVGGVDFGDRHARRRRRIRIALVALVLVLAAIGVWLIAFSSVFAVKGVRVVGIDGDRATEVLRVAAVPTGVPLARIDTNSAQARVAELPWISSVDVRRGWPNEVVLAVRPRMPIAVLVNAEGREAVDADGVAFAVADEVTRGLPVVKAEGAGIGAATAVLAALPPELSQAIVSLTATSRDNVDLRLKSGVLVHWGSADQPAEKSEVLLALMRHKADVYDVSAPELPTTYKG